MPSISDLIYKSVENKTTFTSAQKDLFSIAKKLMDNDKLKKSLFYTSPDSLSKPNLTAEQSLGLLHQNIRVIPKLPIEDTIMSYVIVSFDNFVPNSTNPEFRDNTITFDVICHLSTWVMDDYNLRPFVILGEIDGMIANNKLSGIGRVEMVGANALILSNELAGYSIVYRVINDADR